MKINHVLITLGLLAVVVGGLAFGRRQQSAAPPTQQSTKVPDNVAYRLLFHQVNAFRKKAEEDERDGKMSSHLRTHFKRNGGLDQSQAYMLNELASEYDLEETQLNVKAQIIIDVYRAQYPGGQVPQGVALQPPPPELKSVSRERDAIVLRYRDRLHQAFGDDEFNRFDHFVKSRLVPNTPQQSANQ